MVVVVEVVVVVVVVEMPSIIRSASFDRTQCVAAFDGNGCMRMSLLSLNATASDHSNLFNYTIVCVL